MGHLPKTTILAQKAETGMRKTLNLIFVFSIYLMHLPLSYCVYGVAYKRGNEKI